MGFVSLLGFGTGVGSVYRGGEADEFDDDESADGEKDSTSFS